MYNEATPINQANLMSNRLDSALNPAAHTAFLAAVASSSTTSPATLLKQVESLLGSMLNDNGMVAEQYRNAALLSRSIAEQTMLARAVQCSDPKEALQWLAAAKKLAEIRETASELSQDTPQPRPVTGSRATIVIDNNGSPIDEESRRAQAMIDSVGVKPIAAVPQLDW